MAEIKVFDEVEAEEAQVLICMRVEDCPSLPTYPHAQADCVECGKPVYCSLQSPISPPRMCILCALIKMQEFQEKGEEITVGTSKEMIEEACGLPPKPRTKH